MNTHNEASQPLSLRQAKTYINEIDFAEVINKMSRSRGWSRRHVLAACELYRHFLYLKRKNGDEQYLPPSEDIDEFWHAHILDTHKYQKDCQIIFGDYLHHYPYFGIDGKITREDALTAFEITQKLHYQEFGDYIYRVRLQPLKAMHRSLKNIMMRFYKTVRRHVTASKSNRLESMH